MKWSLTVLGSSSALPADNRMLSAQLLTTGRHHFLFDCGEGTQFQLRRFKAPLNKIDAIFISHLHGDHFFGLFGLLSTYSMYKRENPLRIFAFPQLRDTLEKVLEAANLRLKFDLQFVELKNDGKELIFEDKELKVSSIPLKHSVPVTGFLVEEKIPELNIKKDFAESHDIPHQWFSRIKNGEDYVDKAGHRYANEDITYSKRAPKSYAYLSDTAYEPRIAEMVKGVGLMYHEATFAEAEAADARDKLHSTASQAALCAKAAGADSLLIGHFSTRYADTRILEQEAQKIFRETRCVYDGMEVKF